MPWIGRFQKDTDRPTSSKIGVGSADWYDAEVLICTYSRRIDGQSDAAGFKQDAIAYRDKFILDEAKNVELSGNLTTFLNQ